MALTSLLAGAMASAFFASSASAAVIYPPRASILTSNTAVQNLHEVTATVSSESPSASVFFPSPNHKDNIAARQDNLIGKECWKDCQDRYHDNPFTLRHCLKFCPWSTTDEQSNILSSDQGLQSSTSLSSATPSSSSHSEQKRQLVSPFPDERYPWYTKCIDRCDELLSVANEVRMCMEHCFVSLPSGEQPHGHSKRSPASNDNPNLLPVAHRHHSQGPPSSATPASASSRPIIQHESPPPKQSYNPWTHSVIPHSYSSPSSEIIPHSREYMACVCSCVNRSALSPADNADMYADQNRPNNPADCESVCSMADLASPESFLNAEDNDNDRNDRNDDVDNGNHYVVHAKADGWLDPFEVDPFLKCRQQCLSDELNDYAYCTDECQVLSHEWTDGP